MKDATLILRLPADLRAALESAATEDRRGLSDFVRLALQDALASRQGATGAKRKGGR